MGWYDYLADLTSSFNLVGTAYADSNTTSREYEGPIDPSGETSDARDARGGGIGTAQHDRDATTRGGVSTKSPAAGTDEESASEKEANEADAAKQQDKQGEGEKGHTPGEGGEASGQVGPKAAEDGEEEEDEEAGDKEEEEEEEEEEEPEDPKPKLEEECMRSQRCAPLKHHYDECAERVQQQHEEHGKAHEDCVEEFFHLMHCASECAAPKLFRMLR